MRRHRFPALVPPITLAVLLCGCGSSVRLDKPTPPDSRTTTVSGNHEAIAWCLADMANRSTAGEPRQRVDKAAGVSTLTRAGQYEITLRQLGVTRVQAEGRRMPGGGDGLDFVWPHVEQCATQLSAP